MTMTKKLIDWASVPNGVAVVNITDKSDEWMGELLGSVTNKTMLIKRTKRSSSMGIDVVSIAPCLQKYLRLAPAEQQPWLVYEEGVTVIPEWAVCEYRGFSRGQEMHAHQETYSIDFVAHYRITGIKAGWTDNPNEVTG